MVARGRSLGAITFVGAESGRRFDDSDLELAAEIGRRTGIAVDNARLYRDRSHVAKTLQDSLLPARLPEIPGFTTAARFRATGAGTEVGGDFYDLYESSGGRWTIAIGDVCGKGPDAAAVTALARYTLRAVAMTEPLPSRTLESLNEAMLRQRADMRFCTVAYGVLDRSDGGRVRLSLACAGHPPPLLLEPDGSVRELGEPGTLLGVVPDPDLPDTSTDIEPGDTVVFYTDGVTEARGANGSFGPADLAALLSRSAGLDPDSIAGRIEEAAVRTGEGEPRDDIAVVVVRLAA
jgi:serine phosphatase RsbU (regulator of sigma subunit)